MEDKGFIFRWRRNFEFSLMLHVYGVIFIIAMIAIVGTDPQVVFLILLGISIFLQIPIFVYDKYVGWNKIYFDNEKVWQIVKGKKYKWHWNEMTSCNIRDHRFLGVPILIPSIIEIVTKPNYKKLTFAWNNKRHKAFLKICSNELIKEQFVKGMIN